MKLLILGAGGHGRVCEEIACKKYETISFLDDNSFNAIGTLSKYVDLMDEYDEIFVAFGNPELRRKWTNKVREAGYRIATILSEKALISKSAIIEEGSVIMDGAVIQTGVKICCGSIISPCAVVDHDSIVEEYCHINAGAIVASGTIVKKMTKVGYREVYV